MGGTKLGLCNKHVLHYEGLTTRQFPAAVDVVEFVSVEGSDPNMQAQADTLLNTMCSFDFVICLFTMHKLMGITNDLNKALQQSNLDILVNALSVATVTKNRPP